MTEEWVQDFIDALHTLEDQGDVEPIAHVFARDAALWNLIMPEPRRGAAAVRAFWEEYRGHFGRIHSRFERIIVNGDQAALEWRAEGDLQQGGRPVAYRGVTLLQNGPEGITEFASYYDPEPFREGLGIGQRRAA